MKEIWVKKYMPTTLADYVFKDANQKQKIESWVKSGALPNILLSGSPGVGKSALINVLLSELKIDKFDILEINASKNNGVDYIKDTVTRFAETMGYGDIRYVILQEADHLSINAQAVLRDDMERYSDSVRYLLTVNYPRKIIPALHSRTELGRMVIDKLDRDEFTLRICNILIAENIEFEMDVIDAVVENTYPDLRRGISNAQSNSTTGKLMLPDVAEIVADYKIDMIALFKEGKYKEARQLICSQVRQEEYEDMFRFMYQNVEIWGDSEEKQNKAILVIRDGLVKHTSIADAEINLSATLIELELIANNLI
jgi:DNA polymerase III delta prime subunit